MSPWIYEHTLARHYGWDLDKIRNMDLQDFHVHLRICFGREAADREFQINLAGFGNTENINKSGENTKKTSIINERTRNDRRTLRKEIGNLKVNKKTGKVMTFNQPEFPEKT